MADAINYVLHHAEDFDPRSWALENAGYTNATRKLNAALSELAHHRGLPWTRDIVAKKNAPNLRYVELGRYKEFEEEYEGLGDFLLPPE